MAALQGPGGGVAFTGTAKRKKPCDTNLQSSAGPGPGRWGQGTRANLGQEWGQTRLAVQGSPC